MYASGRESCQFHAQMGAIRLAIAHFQIEFQVSPVNIEDGMSVIPKIAVFRCILLLGAAVLAFGLVQPQSVQARCGEYVQIGGETSAVNSHLARFHDKDVLPTSLRMEGQQPSPGLPCSCRGSSCSNEDRNLPIPSPAKIRLVSFDDVWFAAAQLTETANPTWPSPQVECRDGSDLHSLVYRPPR